MRVAAVVVALVLSLSACSEVEETSGGYEPARLEAVAGSEFKRVTFTEEGARRTGLRTVTIGGDRVVPSAALIYDAGGISYVYTVAGPLSYVRAEVVAEGAEGDRVRLGAGPPPGTEIVTVGAAEVYGAELEISGGH